MKAAILYAVGERLVVDDVDLDPPKEGEVLVRLAASGVCGSDLHVMDEAPRIRCPCCSDMRGPASWRR